LGNRADRREGETESNGLGEREKQRWLRTEMAWVKMAVSEIKQLSIFRDANQSNKQTVNQDLGGSTFLD
jgi:hypothetical protein